MTALVHSYNQQGWTELGAFAAMRAFLANTPWTVRGIDIDTTADRVWSRLTGSPDELSRNFSDLEVALDAPGRLALPTGYLARTAKDNLLAPWNGPQVTEVVTPGWSANKPGFPTNPNARTHGMVWLPSHDPRVLGLMPADAPGILAVHRSGVMGQLLQVWHALRDGSTQDFFDLMALLVHEETGEPMNMKDVFVVCVLGARVGFGLTGDARNFMVREQETRYEQLPNPHGDIFRRNITPVGDRFSVVNYTVEERPFDLDLGKLAYELVLAAEFNGTKIPENQVIFDPRCTLTWRNEAGVLTRQSKRLRDGQDGAGAFTGVTPAPRKATCFSGMGVYPRPCPTA